VSKQNGDGYRENLLGAGLLGGKYCTPAAQEFPLGVLPNPLRAFVTQQAKAMNVPSDYIAGPLLVALGGAIGLNRILEIKRGYEVSGALWLVVVGGSGMAKSPALKKAIGFLNDSEQEEEVRIIVSDTTMEALVELMMRNPRGLVQVIDEMAGFTKRFNKYRGGLGSDEQDYLSLWSGEKITVDRKGLIKPLIVQYPFLGLVGTIQPSTLKEFFTPLRIQSGMAPRILVVWPEEIPSEYSVATVDEAAIEKVREVFKKLRGPEEKILAFSEKAKAVWFDEANKNCDEQNVLPEIFKGTWSKMQSYAGRLILIIHTVKEALGLADDEVQADTVKDGWRLVEYFKAQVIKTYLKLEAIKKIKQTKSSKERLLDWIKRKAIKEITVREVISSGVFDSMGRMDAASARELLNELESEGLGKWNLKGNKFLVNLNPAPSSPANVAPT